jgi:hypothetical protein
MTQREELLDLFRRHGHALTLRQILESRVGYEWRARATELRDLGHQITLERGRAPSDNLYRLIEPETSGQTRFA